MKTKKCGKCKKIKSIIEFSKDKNKKDNHAYWCRSCAKEASRKYYLEIVKSPNKKTFKRCPTCNKNFSGHGNSVYCKECRKKVKRRRSAESSKKWKKNHPVELEKRRRRYYSDNKDRINKARRIREKEYRQNDINYRLKQRIKTAVYNSLKHGKDYETTEDILGYRISDLKQHLEKQFKLGMTWGNYGEWHIDHILPISLFEFKSYKDREFKQCWALANLQPLWAEENIRKHNKCLM